jgi:hypothetical protein
MAIRLEYHCNRYNSDRSYDYDNILTIPQVSHGESPWALSL